MGLNGLKPTWGLLPPSYNYIEMCIKGKNERNVNENVEVGVVGCVNVFGLKVLVLRRDLKMNSYKIDEIMNGNTVVPVGSSNGGNGVFQKIRDLVSEHLKETGDSVLLRDVVKVVKERFEMETRKSHNYTRNSLFSKNSGYTKYKKDGVVFVVKD